MIFLSFLYFCLFIHIIFLYNICACENVKKSVEDNRDDDIDDSKDDSLDISSESEVSNSTVCTRRKNSRMHEVYSAAHNQYPFIVAIMSAHDEYICTGSIIANTIILTSDQCTDSANYILVNTTNAKKTDASVKLRVSKVEKHPAHLTKHVAIIYTEKLNNTIASKIKVTNITKTEGSFEMEAVGFGLNAQPGQPKELQSIGLEAEQTGEITGAFINCIDTKVPSCFRDKGGPVIIDDVLVGVVVKGEEECTSQISSTYASNKHIIDFLNTYAFKAWLDEKVTTSEEKTGASLEIYPTKPIARKNLQLTTSVANRLLKNTFFTVLANYFLLTFF